MYTQCEGNNIDVVSKLEDLDEKLLLKNGNHNNTSPKKASRWVYLILFLIWFLSVWHLLTMKEKILIKHDIVINANISRGEF